MKGTVTVPFSGYLHVYVNDVSDADEAWEQAIEKASEMSNRQWSDAIGEVEYHREMNRGNVCVAVCPEAEFDLEDELDEDCAKSNETRGDAFSDGDELCLGVVIFQIICSI